LLIRYKIQTKGIRNRLATRFRTLTLRKLNILELFPMLSYVRSSVDEIISKFGSDGELGLTPLEVISRRRIHGPNKLEQAEKVKL